VRGRNVTRAGKRSGVVDLNGWVASWGQKTSGECARRPFAGVLMISGQTLKWDSSLRKVTAPGQGVCLRVEDREVDANHEAGAFNPCQC
jgi:hypothetical protein